MENQEQLVILPQTPKSLCGCETRKASPLPCQFRFHKPLLRKAGTLPPEVRSPVLQYGTLCKLLKTKEAPVQAKA